MADGSTNVGANLPMKTLTRKQLESRKAKAVRFTRDVLGDPERAAEIEDESLESYAERRHYPNPKSERSEMHMAIPTRRELVEESRNSKRE